MGAPLLEVLFERGKFDQEAVLQTAQILKIYSVLLVILSLVQLLSSCFYAVKNTWFPAVSTFTGLAVHVVVAPLFISLYQLKGLIWATTLSSLIQFILLALAYPKFIGSFYLKRTAVRFVKVTPFLVVFGFYIHYVFEGSLWVLQMKMSEDYAQFLALTMTGLSSMFLYGYFGVRFRLVQAREFIHLFRSKFKAGSKK